MSKFRILKDGEDTFYVEQFIKGEWRSASLGMPNLEVAERYIKTIQKKVVKIIEDEDPEEVKAHSDLDEVSELKQKIIMLEASNGLLRHLIKIMRDPQKFEEERAEFKEFLDSIHTQEEKAE